MNSRTLTAFLCSLISFLFSIITFIIRRRIEKESIIYLNQLLECLAKLQISRELLKEIHHKIKLRDEKYETIDKTRNEAN